MRKKKHWLVGDKRTDDMETENFKAEAASNSGADAKWSKAGGCQCKHWQWECCISLCIPKGDHSQPVNHIVFVQVLTLSMVGQGKSTEYRGRCPRVSHGQSRSSFRKSKGQQQKHSSHTISSREWAEIQVWILLYNLQGVATPTLTHGKLSNYRISINHIKLVWGHF